MIIEEEDARRVLDGGSVEKWGRPLMLRAFRYVDDKPEVVRYWADYKKPLYRMPVEKDVRILAVALCNTTAGNEHKKQLVFG